MESIAALLALRIPLRMIKEWGSVNLVLRAIFPGKGAPIASLWVR